MHYHHVIIELFGNLTTIPVAPTQLPVIIPDVADEWQNVLGTSIARLETLVRVYHSRHGVETHDPFLWQFLLLLGSISLRNKTDVLLSEGGRSTFILCAKGLHEQGRHDYWAEALFRLLCDSMPTDDESITRAIAVVVKNQMGLDKLQLQYMHATWPVFNYKDASNRRFSELVRMYNELSLDDDVFSDTESSTSFYLETEELSKP